MVLASIPIVGRKQGRAHCFPPRSRDTRPVLDADHDPPGPVHGAPLGVVRGRPVYRNTEAHHHQTPFMAGVGLADFCKNSVFLKPISAASDNFLYYYEQSFDYKCMTESKRMIICLYVHFVN